MMERMDLKAFLSPGRLMKSVIATMHYQYWRICSSLSGKDLRKRLEYLLTEVAAVESLPGLEPDDENGNCRRIDQYCRDVVDDRHVASGNLFSRA
jgi:hypothetical protein